jgi:hypothetical protein
MGQLATLLYSRLAHKEATGNSAYFLEYKPHLTNIHSKLLVLQKNRCMRKELKSLSFNQTLDKTSSKHLDNSFHNKVITSYLLDPKTFQAMNLFK